MGLSRVGRRGQTLFPLEAKPSVLVVINEALDLLKSALVFKRQFARPAVAVMKFSPPCYYDSFFFFCLLVHQDQGAGIRSQVLPVRQRCLIMTQQFVTAYSHFKTRCFY